MNVIERLAKSAQNNHGLEIHPTQVKELVAIIQAMQMQIANDQGRLEAQTRILAVALNQVGGALDIIPDLFAEAERYAVDVEWSEEGDNIRASLRLADVVVPDVQQEGTAAANSDPGPVSVQPVDTGGRDESGEANEDGQE